MSKFSKRINESKELYFGKIKNNKVAKKYYSEVSTLFFVLCAFQFTIAFIVSSQSALSDSLLFAAVLSLILGVVYKWANSTSKQVASVLYLILLMASIFSGIAPKGMDFIVIYLLIRGFLIAKKY